MKKSVSISPEYGSRAHRLAEASACHAIESNPLDAEDFAMFEMFEREGFSSQQRIAYITKLAQQDGESALAAE